MYILSESNLTFLQGSKPSKGLTFSPLRALKYPQNCKWEMR